MAHIHLADAAQTRASKVQGVVGHTKHYIDPRAKADAMAYSKSGLYYENRKLDPPSIHAKKSVGP